MKKKKHHPKLRAVDFFCGAGGVTCGFTKGGIDVIAGIDVDGDCKLTYEANNKGSKFIHADISEYTPEQLAKSVGIKRDDKNLVFVGCSPCQYYTIIQTSKEKSKKSKLLLEDFERFVEYFLPGYIFVENVPGIETKRDSPLRNFKKLLDCLGYSYDDRVVNAKNYKVPQSRKRYVLIASRNHAWVDIPEERPNERMTVRNFIAAKQGFKPIKAGHIDRSLRLHTTAALSAKNLERIKKTPKNGGTRFAWKDDLSLQLPCYKGNDGMFADVYGRMYWDKPSPTITTRFLSISNGRFGHPTQNRGISLREGATLQSFPKTYKFYARKSEMVAKMIGNAVPPMMAKKMAEGLVKLNRARE